jgi:hypothetical protein
MSEIHGTLATPAKPVLRDDVEEALAERDLAPDRPSAGRLFGLPFDFWAFLRERWGSAARQQKMSTESNDRVAYRLLRDQ